MKGSLCVLVMGAMTFGSSMASAQDEGDEAKVVFYDIDDVLILGPLAPPGVLFVDARMRDCMFRVRLKKSVLSKLRETGQEL